MKKVLVESPFAGTGETETERKADEQANVEYARKCMAHCLSLGEAPFASHLLYTQDGVLDDDVPEERELGIEAGLCWGKEARETVVYVDRGFTKGMAKGVRRAFEENRLYTFRTHPEYTDQSKILIACYRFIEDQEDLHSLVDPRQHAEVFHTEISVQSSLLTLSARFDGDIVDFLVYLQESYV